MSGQLGYLTVVCLLWLWRELVWSRRMLALQGELERVRQRRALPDEPTQPNARICAVCGGLVRRRPTTDEPPQLAAVCGVCGGLVRRR